MSSLQDNPLSTPIPMSKPKPRSLLYRLIEAGQLTHRALLQPLKERGLEPGDDAVLFELGASEGLSELALAEALGIDVEALAPRLERLTGRELVERRALGPELRSGLALTDRGERIRDALATSWEVLEENLVGELTPKQRKGLAKRLKTITGKLKL